MRKLYIHFHGGCTNLHSQQYCVLYTVYFYILDNVQGFPFLHMLNNIRYLLSLIAILTGVKEYLIVLLIYIFLLISTVFIYLLAICMSSLEKCLLKSFAHFLIGLFYWLIDWFTYCYWVVWVPYIFWILTSYQICGL